MNIEAAEKIEGWCSTDDLTWLAKKASTHTRIAEIGSWQGRSTTALADHTAGRVWAVDTWFGSEEHQPVHHRVYELFCANMWKQITLGKVVSVRLPSVTAAKFFQDAGAKFDMVFIDAAHDFYSVKADILAWWPLLEPGGLLCGHDAGHPPVMECTKAIFGPNRHHEGSFWVADL